MFTDANAIYHIHIFLLSIFHDRQGEMKLNLLIHVTQVPDQYFHVIRTRSLGIPLPLRFCFCRSEGGARNYISKFSSDVQSVGLWTTVCGTRLNDAECGPTLAAPTPMALLEPQIIRGVVPGFAF